MAMGYLYNEILEFRSELYSDLNISNTPFSHTLLSEFSES